MKNRQNLFYLFTIAIFFSLIYPNLLSDGMFLDGLTYAAISNNLAHDLGSFWSLFFTNTLYPHFYEHPPLAFGIQSIFFKIFGDSIIIERMYSLTTFIITGFLIVHIWKRVTDSKFHKLAWLPLFFWISIPLIIWAAPNNMLENTMMIFTSSSILFFLKSTEKNKMLNLVLAGIMLFLGVLTKGLVALFPLTFLLWFFVFSDKRSFKQLVIDYIIVLLILVIPFILLFIFIPESYINLLAYFNKQIIGSIKNIQTVDSRFYIIWRLFNELIPMIILVLLAWFFTKKYKSINIKEKWFLIFISIGLSGVIPMIISMKQSGFYILATFPLFSVAFAVLVMKNVNFLVERININSKMYIFFNYFSYIILLLSIVLNLLQLNKIGRDKDEIQDIYAIIDYVPAKSVISVPSSLWSDWSLHGYFQRYGYISLDSDTTNYHRYLLVRNDNIDNLPVIYKKTPVNLKKFILYENVKNTNL